jgi:hypothetical protein
MTVASAGASASIRSGGPGPRAAATATRSLAAATATRSKRHLEGGPLLRRTTVTTIATRCVAYMGLTGLNLSSVISLIFENRFFVSLL